MAFHKQLVGEDLHSPSQEQVENNTGSAIAALKVVKYTGLGTNYPEIGVITSTSDVAAGIVTASFATATSAYIQAFGRLNNIDTSSFTVGTQVFADASGDLTATNTGIPVGVVLVSNATTGVLFVNIAGKGEQGDPGTSMTSVSVTDIDDPSTELASESGAAVSDLIVVYEINGGTTADEHTIYAWDTETITANSPYIVSGSGGTWIAAGGKYINSVQTVSQVEAEAGTSTTVRRWTAERVAQAIAALGAVDDFNQKTVIFDEFPPNNEDSDELGTNGWRRTSSGTGNQGVMIDGETGHPGIYRMGCGTAAGARSTIYLGEPGNDLCAVGGGSIVYDCVVRGTGAIGNFQRMLAGLAQRVTTNAEWTEGIYFRILDGGTNWEFVTSSGGTKTTRDTGVAYTSGNWVRLGFTINAAGTSIQARVNGSNVSTAITTNIPSVAISPTFLSGALAAGGGTDSTLDADMVRVEFNYSSDRND